MDFENSQWQTRKVQAIGQASVSFMLIFILMENKVQTSWMKNI